MRNKVTRNKKPRTIVRIIKTPIRAISKVLDHYVSCVTNFSNAYNRPLMTMQANPNCDKQFPRSYSSSSMLSNYEEPPEGALLRSISSTAVTTKKGGQVKIAEMELYMVQYRHPQLQSYGSSKGVPMSCSVGMRKIDEDKVCSFRDDCGIVQSKLSIMDKDSMFSRSRSYDRVCTKKSNFV
ncbi:hypothetical protein QVD17_09220 [Tagetes erecta]|uniref:Uncharacterized protein n=1 Tax=Tagetes erecta TaxID=13708 RepID=A0AAD8L6X5_TARER|nr:hypothetical protein QVD17_09220 [Tagetes erecta]